MLDFRGVIVAKGRLGEVANDGFVVFQFTESGLAGCFGETRLTERGALGDCTLFRFIAAKRSIKFRFPKAASRH